MAGTIAQGELNIGAGKLSFAIAGEEDDAEIRALLRGNPMVGDIRVTLEREPNYFQSIVVGCDKHQTIIVRNRATGRMICVGSVTESIRYVNGSPTRVGYLSGLRLDGSEKANAAAIRGGFRLFRQLHSQGGPPIYLTSIISDNVRARRLLEAGLPGMPHYRAVDEFITLIMPVRREKVMDAGSVGQSRLARTGFTLRQAKNSDAKELAAFLDRHGREHQFSPCWTEEYIFGDESAQTPRPSDFHLVLNHGKIIGCAALWDQRSFKQIVIQGYSDRLGRWRPLLNLLSQFSPALRLPAISQPLRQAYISHLATDADHPEILVPLIQSLHTPAHQRGLDYLIVGLSAGDSRLTAIRRKFGCRAYPSQLYVVQWSDSGSDADTIDARIAFPEVATL